MHIDTSLIAKIFEIHRKFFKDHNADEIFLSMALAGEVGEFCNMIKKTMRGDFTIESHLKEFQYEWADIFIYLILLSYQLQINDIYSLCMEKLDIVDKRISK